MYEPLHHKYRPQTFAQLVGQGAIAATLTNALQQNRIAPAYLFCGPRGTGKTSSARILAKSLNCLTVNEPTAAPCGECDVCQSVTKGSSLDIVEIDAASNTGVDNIRELIERSQFAPVQCRYKVYVIDECHMLSTAAFNALLKTLEEPPDRVVFVLATTDPQRVLPTIISRCQRFDFRRIPLPSMIEHLQHIATKESIAIAPSATQLVAQISQGGLRDAESLLDQLSLQADEISVESVWDLVGAVPERDLLNLVRAIAADDGTALLERVRQLMDKGREPLIVLQSLVGFYRDLLIAKQAPAREDLVAITPPTWAQMTEFAQQLSAAQLLASQQKLQTSEVQVKNTTQPRLWLEVTLTGLLPSALGAIAQINTQTTSNVRPSSPAGTASTPSMARPKAAPPPIVPPAITAPIASTAPPTSPPTSPPTAAPSAAITPVAPAASTPPAAPPAPPSTPKANPTNAESANTPTQPNATPTPSEPLGDEGNGTADSPPPEVDFGSLSDLWNKVLAVVVPRATQIMMSQQGILLGFDGVGAKVGCRSAGMQKLIQSRVPNLETAFESIFQRKIKVSLELLSAESMPKTEIKEPPPAPPAPPTPRAQTQKPAAPSDAPYSPPPPNAAPPTEVNNTAPKPPDTSNSGSPKAISDAPKPGNNLPSNRPPGQAGPSRLDAPSGNIGFDQDQEKVKRFANFFNGEIVSLDGESTSDRNDNTPTNPSEKSSDPGPDVPF
ncbi:MAG: DNA polymerase III subunit gamma/tau [Cyanobacteria bacterium P01_C01_bin.69]